VGFGLEVVVVGGAVVGGEVEAVAVATETVVVGSPVSEPDCEGSSEVEPVVVGAETVTPGSIPMNTGPAWVRSSSGTSLPTSAEPAIGERGVVVLEATMVVVK
jgi:hypothetical protein